jgi:protein-S-isoprenylcysteine O-methyltransferase Ste14
VDVASTPAPAARPSPVAARAVAALYGVACHALFAAAVVAMFLAMRSGMTLGRGRLPDALAVAGNALLLLAFPAGHSLLLTARGRRVLDRLAPAPLATTLRPTTYAIVASLQTLALFLLWTPSGVVWWRATGAFEVLLTVASALAWALLGWAILDAGASLQTGWLGWRAAMRGEAPRYPAMPERGLFRVVRQPIYVAFAATTWTVPTWTPDQLAVAVVLTAYCVVGPRWKERRFLAAHGPRFEAYRARVPYWVPGRRPR